jgi:hypothetical protein
MIQECTEFTDYPIVLLHDVLFTPEPPAPAFARTTRNLFRIHKALVDPTTGKMLSQSSIHHLFRLISSKLFRPIPSFRGPSELFDLTDICIVKNWSHIELFHQMLQFLMRDPHTCGSFIDADFVSQLIRQLDSPVYEERHELEVDLRIVIELYKRHRRLILQGLLAKVISFLDGVRTFSASIDHVLRLFQCYFASIPGQMPQSNFLMFRTVFYPLFGTELSFLFEHSLSELCFFFQAQDPATAFWCLKYLRRHWPKSSSRKQSVFFRQLCGLLPLLPLTMFAKVAPVIVRTIAPCLTSCHWEIALAATLFCAQDSFLSVFRASPDVISSVVMESAKRATEHWNEEERAAADCFFDKLKKFDFKSKPATRAVGKTVETAKMGWGDVVEMAVANDAGIDRDGQMEIVAKLQVADSAVIPSP